MINVKYVLVVIKAYANIVKDLIERIKTLLYLMMKVQKNKIIFVNVKTIFKP